MQISTPGHLIFQLIPPHHGTPNNPIRGNHSGDHLGEISSPIIAPFPPGPTPFQLGPRLPPIHNSLNQNIGIRLAPKTSSISPPFWNQNPINLPRSSCIYKRPAACSPPSHRVYTNIQQPRGRDFTHFHLVFTNVQQSTFPVYTSVQQRSLCIYKHPAD